MCDERERLIDYVYDECGAEERQIVDRHLETCQTCREEIAGLRSTRQDLLAWEVPDHGSVWKPFVPARVRPWYREVPAWAMAAAAGIMFAIGISGGLVAHAFTPHEEKAVAAVQPQPTTDAVGRAELAALETRIVDSMRADMSQLDARVRLVSQRTAQQPGVVQVSDMARGDVALYSSVNNEMAGLVARMKRLDERITQLQNVMAQQAGSGASR
jgi:anti-sigma factor RsiW